MSPLEALGDLAVGRYDGDSEQFEVSLARLLPKLGAHLERARRVFDVRQATAGDADAWVNASLPDGSRPSLATRHNRRSAARLGFRLLREAGVVDHDPTVDIHLVEVEIHLVGGAPHLRTYDVDGNQHLQPLRRRRLNQRLNKATGTYRMSAEYAVDDPTGQPDGYIRIRLDQTAQDELAGYSRPEHLRAFPEEDPIFVDIQQPLRAAAESANRTIDDHLPRERLHHYGFDTNQLSMLAWQAYRNAQVEAVFTTARSPSSADPPLPRAS